MLELDLYGIEEGKFQGFAQQAGEGPPGYYAGKSNKDDVPRDGEGGGEGMAAPWCSAVLSQLGEAEWCGRSIGAARKAKGSVGEQEEGSGVGIWAKAIMDACHRGR